MEQEERIAELERTILRHLEADRTREVFHRLSDSDVLSLKKLIEELAGEDSGN